MSTAGAAIALTLALVLGIWASIGMRAIHALGRFTNLYRKMKRRGRGECVACGYDLRGNTSGVCPECGDSGGSFGRMT